LTLYEQKEYINLLKLFAHQIVAIFVQEKDIE